MKTKQIILTIAFIIAPSLAHAGEIILTPGGAYQSENQIIRCVEGNPPISNNPYYPYTLLALSEVRALLKNRGIGACRIETLNRGDGGFEFFISNRYRNGGISLIALSRIYPNGEKGALDAAFLNGDCE